MKVKTQSEWLGIPKGSIGEIVKFANRMGECEKTFATECLIKFPCKDEPVLVQFPGITSHYGTLYNEHIDEES